MSHGPVNSVFTKTINISSTAVLGSTRMRVSMKFDSAPNSSCETLPYGEVEDYLDHKNLNLDIDDFKNLNPSAENIAVLIYNRLIKYFDDSFKLKITLYETPRNFVEYSG